MHHRQRQSVILALLDAMQNKGSWCGETHLQKAAYFLEELTKVDLGLDFILYKHGPFSFLLRDELTAMRADYLIELESLYPYGPRLKVTEPGKKLMGNWSKTLEESKSKIGFVAEHLGNLNVAELERITTAHYVSKQEQDQDTDSRARHIHQIKPHLSVEEAREAIISVEKIVKEYNSANV
ncbi:MAG: hypothetical protein H8E87_06260 [FCB group bacterium]|nr:hypothetical protein [FCB group bacterium]